MNALWKVFLSMSLSGSLLILVLFLGKHFWKDKISRQWQYYIWLAALTLWAGHKPAGKNLSGN